MKPNLKSCAIATHSKMGIGGSKDERIHMNNIVVKGKYLQPLTNIDIRRGGSVNTVRAKVETAKTQADEQVRVLSGALSSIQKDISMLQSKQAGLQKLLDVTRQSQAAYTNSYTKLGAVQGLPSSVGFARNSSAAIRQLRGK